MNPSENTPPEQDAPPNVEVGASNTTPKNLHRRKLLIIGIISAIGICLCVGFCAFSGIRGMYEIATEKDNIAKPIDNYMKAMVRKDLEAAYSLFSQRAKRQIPISEFEEMITDANYALYDGYEKIELKNINLTNSFNTNPDVPQGKVANVDGMIVYKNYAGSFRAILEKEDEEWFLHGINVTVPPDKLKDYLEENP